MDSPSPTEEGSARDSHPFSVSPSSFPFFFQGTPVQPCLQQHRRCRAWSSFLAAEETGSALRSPLWSQHYSKKSQTKAGSNALNQISCISKRQFSEHLLTQSSQHKGVLQVVFPVINSHINTREAWIWHLRVVLSLEWVHSFTTQGKDGRVWKQETNET